MIDPISNSDNYMAARKMLDAAVLRQEAISANIANAETPGYRRVDVSPDFQLQLKSMMEAGNFAQNAKNLQPTLEQDLHSRSTGPDGNTVELEKELVAMNRNTIDHEFLTQLVTGHIKQLKVAISGRLGT
jgi:flagellar basal-body rod protein FlgB